MTHHEEYLICQKRGHQSDGNVYTSNPPQSQCKWCGTFYRRSEPVILESGVPEPDE